MKVQLTFNDPELFSGFLDTGLLGRAIRDQKLTVRLENFREFGLGKHKKVDDSICGGGAGMLLRPEPIVDALEEAEKKWGQKARRILISPRGTPFNQAKARQLAQLKEPLALICGRFEGFDERVSQFVEEEISLGDFVMMGGEVAAMALIEAVARLEESVIGNAESLEDESFEKGLLECAHYTKPPVFRGLAVPELLLGGDHKKIDAWRQESAKETTGQRRPDLLGQDRPGK